MRGFGVRGKLRTLSSTAGEALPGMDSCSPPPCTSLPSRPGPQGKWAAGCHLWPMGHRMQRVLTAQLTVGKTRSRGNREVSVTSFWFFVFSSEKFHMGSNYHTNMICVCVCISPFLTLKVMPMHERNFGKHKKSKAKNRNHWQDHLWLLPMWVNALWKHFCFLRWNLPFGAEVYES